ncbi:Gfo/Idh/MocA family protein [Sphingobium sp. EP60837]|uniref:Gfo/Idh/MocA family protein n=1 Tax=Sphingobium sp. EP60837 TaxID=1855519 RepID=UPI0007DD401B|nr:Gfo/Idh/MocA family oxidoreductase [Sphingobium sp. EP60837]ANI78464.1 Inositol 2-dehydrogenase [Sphingobium sp. EP60837]
MNARLKFLVSGPGLIGKTHAKLIAARPDCKLSAIVAPPQPENKAFAASLGSVLFPDIESAMAANDFDGVIVSSPNKFHFNQAAACIERGVPVLVEKPITENTSTALQLVEMAERKGTPVLVGHHRTHSPLLEVVEDFLNSPSFGQPVALQGSALFYKPKHYFEDGSWRALLGGGPILINMIHEIGLMRFFYGEIDSVFATASHFTRCFEVEDTVAITIQFVNGALGTFLLSDVAASNRSWEMTSGENPAYPYFPTNDCYHFAGTNGSLDFPSMAVRCYGADTDPSWWHPFEQGKLEVQRADPLERQISHFVDVIRGRAKPLVSARDGYRNMQVVEAIRHSIENRTVAKIDHVSI